MPTPPPRKRFQLHLSTAIVLMFVAGGLIGLNIYGGIDDPRFLSMQGTLRIKAYGWPLISIAVYNDTRSFAYFGRLGVLDFEALIDITVAIIALLSTWYLCEWLIRRRAARKDA